jgi:hypothetical protein
MKIFWRLLLLASTIVAINVATYLVLHSNQAAGLYNGNVRSLEIVFSAGRDMSMYVAAWAIPAFVISSLDWPYQFVTDHPGARAWLVGALALTYLWIAWLFFAWGVVFWRPSHFLLAAICSASALVPLWMGALDIRRVRSNNSFKPNPLRSFKIPPGSSGGSA